jgi:serine O-acetyltransferase
MMRVSLSRDDLVSYLQRLDANYLPDGLAPRHDLRPLVEAALERVEHCFSHIHRKYYRDGSTVTFDHLHGDHMAAFLYLLGNTVWTRTGDTLAPTRWSYLNKILHGLDLFYMVAMPDIFLLVHPVGTVLGRARYADYLVVYQNCTVGADTDIYPTFSEGVILYSRCSVLGASRIGRNVVFAANTTIIDGAVADDTLVRGQFPDNTFSPNLRSVHDRCFRPGRLQAR